MTKAVICACIASLFFLVFLYAVDLILFCARENKYFNSGKTDDESIERWKVKQKGTFHPQKKNYYLYLICLCYCRSGEREKAKRLAPFLRPDPLLSVPKKPFLSASRGDS